MKRTTGIIALFLAALALPAQQQVTLDLCHERAVEHYPLSRQGEMLAAGHELALKNLNKNYLPQMNINGQVHYQSDVTKVPIQDMPVFGISPLDKDWYKIMLDVNQVIYDGSATSRQKEVEEANLEIEQQNLEVELYQLKDRVNQVYFGILLLHEQEKILDLHQGTLHERLAQVESGVRNGTVLASNADILRAEILKLEQSAAEVRIAREATIAILEEYTGLQFGEDTEFLLPDIQVNLDSYQNNRPEYTLFSLQQRKLEASKHLVGARNLPRLSAFGQAGYGRPGYDMLKNQFDDFYMIGARLTWNVWDWNKAGKEREILDLQQDIIATRQETFDRHVRIDLENKLAGIRKTEKLLQQDDEIIRLRGKITASAEAQLAHGAITSTEYVTELNAESKARLDREVHKIELVRAKIDYQSTLGNL